MKRKQRIILFAAAKIAILTLCLTLTAADRNARIDRSKIYYGDPENFTRPAVVSFLQCLEHTSEYREIKKKGLKKDDAEYWVLLNKANQKVYRAIATAASSLGYDLVGEIGAIQIEGESIPDITPNVVQEVETLNRSG